MNADFEQTRKFWGEEILRGNLVWPDERVIRFVKKNFKVPAVLLDFGCGAGRNAIALAQEGFEIVAMDYTQEAVQAVKRKAESEKTKDLIFRLTVKAWMELLQMAACFIIIKKIIPLFYKICARH